MTLANRNLVKFLRTPPQIVASAIFPALLMFFFFIMFDAATSQFERGAYIQRLLPGMLLTSVTFGSIPMAVALQNDLRTELFQRIRVMPVWPHSLLMSRMVFEVARVLLSSLLLILVGVFLGFTQQLTPVTVLSFMGLLILASVSFSGISFFVAITTTSSELLTMVLTAAYLCAIFASLSMGPVTAFPDWIQPIVAHNPVSLFVEAIRLNTFGQLELSLLSSTIVAAAGLIAMFGLGSFILFYRLFYSQKI